MIFSAVDLKMTSEGGVKSKISTPNAEFRGA
jgi:hypothetical protein